MRTLRTETPKAVTERNGRVTIKIKAQAISVFYEPLFEREPRLAQVKQIEAWLSSTLCSS